MSEVATASGMGDRGGLWLAHALARPRVIALGLVVLVSALGWLYCGLMVAAAMGGGAAGALGPGMGLFDLMAPSDSEVAPWMRVLCAAPFTLNAAFGANMSASMLLFGMWAAMTLAMMLPSAAPMLVTYAELAETAARQREAVVSPLVLAAGYIAVWLGFAAVATAFTVLLQPPQAMAEAIAPGGRWLAAAAFVGAGLYQFSALKQACLRLCRRPFTFFFANWSERPRAVFKLGLRQGLYCLGCCWAAMLVMLAVGLMNVVWMAGLGVAMTMEKMLPGEWLRRALGVAFLAVGGLYAVA